MRSRRAFLAGALLFFWANCAAAAPEWPRPLFLEAENSNGNVTWKIAAYDTNALLSIWEGTEGNIELTRLSYKPDGEEKPKIISGGGGALGIQLERDDSSLNPFFLQTTEPGDFEGGEERFVIRLNEPTATSYIGLVTVDLVNVNDNAPIISSPPECLVEEEYTGPTNCKFQVTDPDGGACYARMLVNDEKFSFHLSSEQTQGCKTATFTLHVDSKLDYETFRLHSLVITAEDDGQVGQNDFLEGDFYQERVIQFVVDVDDIPDEPPRWEVIVPSVTVFEKTAWTEEIRAIDGDYGLNWPIVYHLEYPDDGFDYTDYFTIHKETGILSGRPLNRDVLQREIYKFVVVATEVPPAEFSDFEAMSTSNDIVVMINDLNDNLPLLEPTMVEYIEFPEEEAFTDRNFTVNDPDLADQGTFHLRLEENIWSHNFLLIPSSGYQEVTLTISALDPSLLDYENATWRFIDLTIIAEEEADKTHVSKAVLKIELLDLIDEPPEFEKEEYEVTFTENQPEGYLVVHTIANDPDENDIISYTITNTLMEVDEEGRITSKSANAFDYERQTEIIFQVVATDTGNFKDFTQVIITLIDINDEQPTLIMPPNHFEVDEHDPEGERASYDITATDPDTEANLRFEIDWENSSGYSQGVEVEDDTLYKTSVKLSEPTFEDGQWTTYLVIANSVEFDWEVFDTLRLQITVIDEGTHPDYLHNERSSAILTVIVGDINDNAPVFEDEANREQFIVTENADAGRLIGRLVATDADSPKHNQITYSIEPTFPPELVAAEDGPRVVINPKTGVLTATDTAVDCDAWKTIIYKYKVSASDTKYVTTEEITVHIIDENDKIPDVIEPDGYMLTTSFKEHEPGVQKLTCIVGKDDDYSEDFHTISYFLNGKSNDLFEMKSPCKTLKSCCLTAKDGTDMDREVTPTYVIEVSSRDNYGDESLWKSNVGPIVTITLNLEDINDHGPIFQNTGNSWSTSESIPADAGYNFFEVEVTDKDINENGEIECDPVPEVSSKPERPDGLFKVETVKTVGNDGEIRYWCAVLSTRSFRGLWGVYSLKLKADDKGPKGEGSEIGEGLYELKVVGENLNHPTIEYPTSGTVIRLRRNQDPDNGKPLIDITGKEIENFKTDDKDDPETPNGQVDLILTDPEGVFGLFQEEPHTFRLVLKVSNVPEEKKQFPVTLQAHDRPGLDAQLETLPIDIAIYVIDTDSTPAFTERDTIARFTENQTGLTESWPLPEARNLDEELQELEFRRPIYYYIIGGEAEYFVLDKNTAVLSLQKVLDYESVTEHKITVGATHEDEQPPSNNFYGNAILEVSVEVIDINDMPPEFVQKVFAGVFSIDHEQGTHILYLKAEDPDEDDELHFEIIPNTMVASSDSLKQFENDNAFAVNRNTGAITLNFSPGGRQLDGFFSFDVKVYDNLGDIHGHRDTASVKVFVVSGTHQIIFYFFNTVDAVEAKQDDMATEFSRILGYTCTVDKVRSASTDSEMETEVVSYFVDESDNSPVPREKIEEEFLKTSTNSELYRAMQDLALSFRGYNNAGSQTEQRSYMTIVLAAVCAVLAVLVVVFSLAFVVRTRTLNNRLEKLTNKKFGSQDSGLNRDSLAVPGTNVHALEGSNPVWNHDIDRSFDNMSQSSGDSDLIGIEDSPEFNGEEGGVDNQAYEPRASVNQFEEAFGYREPPPTYDNLPRRTSINPLAAAAAAAAEGGGFEALADPGPLSLEDIGLPRKISLNPLAAELDSVEVDVDVDAKEEAPGNSNFSFQRPAEPSTEL